jgi:hypothetical protein
LAFGVYVQFGAVQLTVPLLPWVKLVIDSAPLSGSLSLASTFVITGVFYGVDAVSSTATGG